MNTSGKKRDWDTRGRAHCFDTGKTSQGSAGKKNKHEHFKEVLRLTNRGALEGQEES